jgi:hypothetical protein
VIPKEKRLKLDFYKNSVLHYFVPKILQDLKNPLLSEIMHHEFMLKDQLFSKPLDGKWQSLIANYLEAYCYSIQQFYARDIQKIPIEDKTVRALVQIGESRYPESITTANIKSVADFLSARGILGDKNKLKETHSKVEEIQHQIQ